MSRQFAWSYTLHPELPFEPDDLWLQIEAALHPRWPQGLCQGGSACTKPAEEAHVSHFFWCNKSKARRVADWLDAKLGVKGELELLIDE